VPATGAHRRQNRAVHRTHQTLMTQAIHGHAYYFSTRSLFTPRQPPNLHASIDHPASYLRAGEERATSSLPRPPRASDRLETIALAGEQMRRRAGSVTLRPSCCDDRRA
jgi:hypothetical protein